MHTIIPVDQGDAVGAIRRFLQNLLDTSFVESVFVPVEVEDGAVIPAIVTDPRVLEQANPIAPVMMINGARAVSALTSKHAPMRMAAVLRSCEIRALIELVKLQQATLEDVVLIGIDCAGTYKPVEYIKLRKDGSLEPTALLLASREGLDFSIPGTPQRMACQMCNQPIPEQADIHLHLFGADITSGIPVTIKDDIAASLSIDAVDFSLNNSKIAQVIENHKQVRINELKSMQDRLVSDGGITNLFASCIRCHNCMTACPICYCKTCLFRSNAFNHEPSAYFQAAQHKGAQRMLSDTLLFHMTRLNHMSTSCVSCGMCTSACPEDIPVGSFFSAISAQVQDTFCYIPGRDLGDKLPLITFNTDEWLDIGEEK